MANIQLNVLFKKMQKDDKKEVLMFHIMSDELPHADELLKMPGKIAVLTVCDLEPIGAEFVNIQRDSKKTVIKFNVKRDDENKVNKLYPFAGNNIDLQLQSSQITIDEFYDENTGIEYVVGEDGTVSLNTVPIEKGSDEDVADGQLDIEELPEFEDPFANVEVKKEVPDENVPF